MVLTTKVESTLALEMAESPNSLDQNTDKETDEASDTVEMVDVDNNDITTLPCYYNEKHVKSALQIFNLH